MALWEGTRMGCWWGGGIITPAGAEAASGVGGVSWLKHSHCSAKQAPSLLFHPFLIAILHSLGVSCHCIVHFSQLESHGEVCIAAVTVTLGHVAGQALGLSVPCYLEMLPHLWF